MDTLLLHYATVAAAFVSAHVGIEVPAALVVCAIYLLLNDALDVALTEKARKGKATLAELLNAVVNDVAQRNALVAAGGAALTAIVAGGDLKATVAAAIFAVAAANVANFEQSTKLKLYQLLKP